jgi:putative ABC transport system permease protein
MGGIACLTAGAIRRGSRTSTFLMFLVLAAAAAGLAAGSTVARSAADRIDAAFADAGGPDGVVTVAAADVAQAQRALVAEPAVTRVNVPRAARVSEMLRHGESLEHLVATAPGAGASSRPIVRQGRLPESDDEIALDAAVGLDLGVRIGDEVVFAGPDGAGITFRVSGTAYDLADCLHPSCDPARSWVTAGGLNRLGGQEFGVIDIDLAGVDSAAVERRLAAAIGDDAFGMNTWPDTRADLLAATNFFAVFLSVFGVLVLVASAVVIASVVSGRVAARRRHAGLHKAVGATPVQLGVAVLLEHLAIAVVAAVTGWIAAAFVTPRLSIGELRVLSTAGASFDVSTLLLVLVVTVVVVAAAVARPAWRMATMPTVESLRDAPRRGRRSRLLGELAGHASPAVQAGVRTWAARPARTLSAVVALTLAMVAGVTALGMGSTMDHLLANPALTGDPWDAVVSANAPAEEVEQQLDRLAEIESWYSIVDTRATLPGGERVHLRLLGGDPQAPGFALGAGRAATAPGELVVGYTLLHDEGWDVGDAVEIEVGDRRRVMRIVGWYRETEDAGRVMQARLGVDDTASARSYAVNAAPGVTRARLSEALRPLGRVELNGGDVDLAPFRLAMSTMATLLAVVAGAHIMATALNVARQRAGDRAVLTAVGFTPGQVRVGALVTAAMTVAVSLAAGLLGGWWLQGAVGRAVMAGVGVGPGVATGLPIARVTALGVGLTALVMAIELGAVTWVRPARAPLT